MTAKCFPGLAALPSVPLRGEGFAAGVASDFSQAARSNTGWYHREVTDEPEGNSSLLHGGLSLCQDKGPLPWRGGRRGRRLPFPEGLQDSSVTQL